MGITVPPLLAAATATAVARPEAEAEAEAEAEVGCWEALWAAPALEACCWLMFFRFCATVVAMAPPLPLTVATS
jgi:hypothetical protein